MKQICILEDLIGYNVIIMVIWNNYKEKNLNLPLLHAGLSYFALFLSIGLSYLQFFVQVRFFVFPLLFIKIFLKKDIRYIYFMVIIRSTQAYRTILTSCNISTQAYGADLVSVSTKEEHGWLTRHLHDTDPLHRKWYTSAMQSTPGYWLNEADGVSLQDMMEAILPDQHNVPSLNYLAYTSVPNQGLQNYLAFTSVPNYGL